MKNFWLNSNEKINTLKKQKGISMVSLVVTIIVIIILSAVAVVASLKTIDDANYSNYVSNLSDVGEAFHETAVAINGNKAIEGNQKLKKQVYNYLAKNGKTEDEFLDPDVVPTYTIIKDAGQMGIELPEMIVESGKGKRIPIKYAVTRNGEIFAWPPFDYEEKLYITNKDMVEHKMQTEITVGDETFTIIIDEVDGSLLDAPEVEPPIIDEPEIPDIPVIPDEPDVDEHEHDFTQKKATLEYLSVGATCVSPATYYYKCIWCDAKGTGTYVYGNSLGHTYTKKIVSDEYLAKEATCTEAPSYYYACVRCDAKGNVEKYTQGIALGHNFDTERITKEATCVDVGIKIKTCSRCGTYETETIPKDSTNHVGTPVTRSESEITCTTGGVVKTYCPSCNAVLDTQTTDALGHDFSAKVQTATYLKSEATCTEAAVYYYKCSRCNERGTETYEAGIAPGHQFGGWVVTKAATCLEDGIETKTCSVCNKKETRTITALGHDWNAPKPPRKCNRCGLEEIEYEQALYFASEKSLVFIKNATLYANGGTYNGKTITTVYTGFATTTYTAITTVPWYNNRTNITNVKFENEISPVSTAYWFAGFINCTEFNLTNLNTTNTRNMNSMFSDCQRVAILNFSDFDMTNVTTMASMFENCYRLEEVTLGVKFAFKGTNGYLPAPSSTYIPKADGKWYENSEAYGYAPNQIPNNVAATYVARKPEPILAANSSWYSQGGTTINRNQITSITIADTYDLAGKTIVDQWDASTNTLGVNDERGPVTAYIEDDGLGTNTYKLTLAGNGSDKIFANEDASYVFSDIAARPTSENISGTANGDLFSALTKIDGAALLDTSRATTIDHMFYRAYLLENVDVSNFDTSNVTSLYATFGYCVSLEEIDVSDWNVENVTSMYYTFGSHREKIGPMKLVSIGDTSNWNTSKVTNMRCMFQGCESFENLEAGNWNVSLVGDMTNMFSDCSSLVKLDVSKWNVSSVENMTSMFSGCLSLATLDVSKWNVSSVENMTSMFSDCSSLTTLDVSKWNVSKVNSIKSMFTNCINLKSLDLSKWDVGNVTNMEFSFGSTSEPMQLTSIGDVGNWNTSKVTTTYCMFQNCNNLEAINVSNWDVSKVTNMAYMFNNCHKIKEYDLSNWNTESLTNMNCMFNDNHSLVTIDVSTFNTSKVQYFQQMFEYCKNLETIVGLENWDTSQGIKFIETFAACPKLKELNLSSWDTSSGQYFHDMFRGCSNLEAIYVSELWSTEGMLDGFWAEDDAAHPGDGYQDGMFNGCTKLVGGAGTRWIDNHVDYETNPDDRMYAHIDGGADNPGYLTNHISLKYPEIDLGETVAPQLVIRAKDFENYTNIKYELLSSEDAEYISIDENTGYVTGLKIGEATVKVTLTNVNGNTTSTTAKVKVNELLEQAIYISEDNSLIFVKDAVRHLVGGTYNGKTITNVYTGFETSVYTAMLDVPWSAKSAIVESVTFEDEIRPISTAYWFSGFTDCITMDLVKLNTTDVTNMNSMFNSCENIAKLDLTNFDTSKVTTMTSMFDNCHRLFEVKLGDKFAFVGNDGYFPVPDANYIPGADGLWYNISERDGYLPEEIPNNKAATYVAAKPEPILAANHTWYSQGGTTINRNQITSITIADTYDTTGKTIVDQWDASTNTLGVDDKIGPVTAYIESDGLGKGTYKLTLAGNVYGKVFANEDASYTFATQVQNSGDAFINMTSIEGTDIFDTSKATTFEGLFAYCRSLNSVDVSNWNVSNVTSLYGTFTYCLSIETLDVSNWDVSNVTNMAHIFATRANITGPMKLKSIIGMEEWDTSNVITMEYLFRGCGNLTELNISNWNTQNVTTMEGTFAYCTSLETLDLTGWDTSNVTTMHYTFGSSEPPMQLKTIKGIENWNMSNVVNASAMFQECYYLEELNVSNWDVSKIENMSWMFNNCKSIKSYDFSKWNTASLTNMNCMLNDNHSLVVVDMSSFNTKNVVSFSQLFENCKNLETIIGLDKWDTSSARSFSQTFNNCVNLKELNLSTWDTSSATSVCQMFNNCRNLETIYVSEKWDMSNLHEDIYDLDGITNSGRRRHIFMGCNKLVGGAGTAYADNHVDYNTNPEDVGYARVDGGEANPGYLTYHVSLKYDKVDLGDTVEPQLIVQAKGFENCTNIKYELASGNAGEYISIDENTGAVTGLKIGDATVKVTLTNESGDVLSATAVVNVRELLEQAIYTSSDSTLTLLKDEVLYVAGNTYNGQTITNVYTGFETAVYTSSTDVPWSAIAGNITNVVIAKQVTPVSTAYWFNNFTNCTNIDIAKLNTMKLTNMNNMFNGCENLATLDLTNFDTSKVTTMASMFNNCHRLFEVKLGDKFAFVGNNGYFPVPDANYIPGADGLWYNISERDGYLPSEIPNNKAATYVAAKPEPILAANSTWYSQGGTTINRNQITSINIVDSYDITGKTIIDQWDASTNTLGTDDNIGPVTAYVEDDGLGTNTYKLTLAGNVYGKVFANEDSIRAFSNPSGTESGDAFINVTMFNGGEIFDTSKATTLSRAFTYAKSLKTIDVSNWDISKVTSLYVIFGNCTLLETIEVEKWDTSKVTDMSYMFYGCESLTELDVATKEVTVNGKTYTAWNTGNVKNFEAIFATKSNTYAMNIIKLEVEDWDTSSCENMKGMFNGCAELTELDLSKWDVSKVTNMSWMFADSPKMEKYNFSGWDTSSVTTFEGMFNENRAVVTLDVSDFDTENVRYFWQMFEGCNSLTNLIGLENFDTTSGTTMLQMFAGCRSIKELNLSSFDTSNVVNICQMFAWCYELETIYVSDKWNMSKLSDNRFTQDSVENSGCKQHVFWNCNKLIGGAGTTYVDNHVDYDVDPTDSMYARIDFGPSNPGYLTYHVSLKYDKVDLGDTVEPELIIQAKGFENYTSIKYELASNEDAEYVSIDENTGAVTGIKIGDATVKVTLTNDAGETLSTTAVVNVCELLEQAIYTASDSTLTLLKDEVLYVAGNTYNGQTITNVYTGFETAVYTSSTDVPWSAIAGNITNVVIANQVTPVSTAYWFNNFTNCTSIDMTKLNTMKLTNMNSMFNGCENLATLDLSNFDTSKVTTMTSMFNNCLRLEEVTLGVDFAFVGEDGYFPVPDANYIPDADGRWYEYSGIASYMPEEIPNNKAATYITKKPEAMLAANTTWYSQGGTTINRNQITSITIADTYDATGKTIIDQWDASTTSLGVGDNLGPVTAYIEDDGLGTNTYKLTLAGNTSGKVFANENSRFAFSNVKSNSGDAFNNMTTFNGGEIFDTSKATTFLGLFAFAYDLEYVDVSNWNTENVTTIEGVFAYCVSIESLDMTNWDVSNVTSMNFAFGTTNRVTGDYMKLTSIGDVSNWDTSKVKDMRCMFQQCSSLENINIGKWNTSSVTDMSFMFNQCRAITELDVATKEVTMNGNTYTAWDTGNVKTMRVMFQSCTSLKNLDVSNWDVSNVNNMYTMFAGCRSMENYELVNWNTSKVTNMFGMFRSNIALTEIDLSSFDTSLVERFGEMFSNCSNLETIYVSNLWNTESMIEGAWNESDLNTETGEYSSYIGVGYQDNIFKNSTKLVGSQGTAYVDNHVDYETSPDDRMYAHIDGGVSDPGYLTNISSIEIEPMLAANSTWYSQGGTTINRNQITSIEIANAYNTTGKTIVDQWDASIYSRGIHDNVGLVTAYVEDDGLGTDTYKLTLAGNGAGQIYANEDSSFVFGSDTENSGDTFINLTAINGANVLDTSKATTFERMFMYADALETIDVSNWDTSKVTNLHGTFAYCASLKELDLSKWDVSSVTDMYYTFATYYVEENPMQLTTIGDVSNWDTSNVITTRAMFQGCTSLENINVENWDTSSIENMGYMFNKCYSLKSLNVGNWDTSNVTDMSYMFCGCEALTELDVTPKTVTVNGETYIAWDTGKVEKFNAMFRAADANTGNMKFNKLEVGNWDTSSATEMASMFFGCGSLTDLDLSSKEVTIGSKTYTSWDVSKVTTMGWMLTDCYQMQNYNFSGWNTASLTNVDCMFNDNHELVTIDVSDFDTEKVTDFAQFFENCVNLENIIGLEKWDVSSGKYFEEMFAASPKIKELNLSSWDTSAAERMYKMFTNCIALETIYVSDLWNTENLVNDSWPEDDESYPGAGYQDIIFMGCQNLVGGAGTAYADNHIDYITNLDDSSYAHIDGGTSNPGYLTHIKDMAEPILAANSTWYSQGGTTINRNQITSIDVVDTYDTTGKTIIDQWDASTSSTGTQDNLGPVTAYVEDDGLGNSTYKLTLVGNGKGKVFANPDSSSVFSFGDYYSSGDAFVNLRTFSGNNIFDTSKVTTLENAFVYAKSLESIDVEDWDMSNVTNLYFTFSFCTSLKNLDVSDWDVSSVENMCATFQSCTSLESLDIGNWNTSSTTNMWAMFRGCSSLTQLDIATKEVTVNGETYTAWDTSNVTTFRAMFSAYEGNTYNMKFAELDVSKWNTSSCEDMSAMFFGCGELTKLDLSKWNVSKVTNMSTMFGDCLKMEDYNFNGWDTSNVTTMNGMFNENRVIATLDVSSFDTENVLIFSQMFEGCNNLSDLIGLENFDTSSATTMAQMFFSCDLIKELNLESFDTSSVVNISQMFAACYELETIYVSDKWDISNLNDDTFMADSIFPTGSKQHIFQGSTKLVGGAGTTYVNNHVDYNTNPTDSIYAHIDGGTSNPGYLTDISDLPGTVVQAIYTEDKTLTFVKDSTRYAANGTYNGSKITNVYTGFDTATYTATANVPWATKVTEIEKVVVEDKIQPVNTAYWFYDFTNCSYVDVSKLDTSKVTNMSNMFAWVGQEASELEIIGLNKFDTSKVVNMTNMFEGIGYKVTNLEISGFENWTTASNADLSYMFSRAGYESESVDIDLGGFDVSKVTNMGSMLGRIGFSKATTFSIGDLSNWDTSNVKDMNRLFFATGANATTFDIGNIGKWNTTNVTNMEGMFLQVASNSATVNIGNLNTKIVTKADGSTYTAWDVSNVTNMGGMFQYAAQTTTSFDIGDLNNWNTAKVTNMAGMFDQAAQNTTTFKFNLSNWNTSNAAIGGMFTNAGKNSTTFDLGNLSNWKLTKTTDLSSMFAYAGQNATTFNIGDISSWSTANVTSMRSMFQNAGQNATTFNIGTLNGWNTAKVTDMQYMFSESGVKELDLSSWTTTTSTEMYGIFTDALKLEIITIGVKFNLAGNSSSVGTLPAIGPDDMPGASYRWYRLSDMGEFWYNSTLPVETATYVPVAYNITYNLDGGTVAVANPIRYSKYSEPFMLNNPTKEGYTFDGWTEGTSDTLVTSMIVSTSDAEDKVYTAHWTEIIEEVPTDIAQALYTSDGSLLFIRDRLYSAGETYTDRDGNVKTVSEVYTGIETDDYGSKYVQNNVTYTVKVPWNGIKESVTKVVVEDTIKPISAYNLFSNFRNCTYFDVEKLDLSNCTTMYGMFTYAGYNKDSITISGMDNWNTSKVTDMNFLFDHLGYNATNVDIGNLSNWNVSNVTSMIATFQTVGRENLATFTQDLSKWEVGKVENMAQMFSGLALNATTWSVGDLSNWNVSNVTNMSTMFSYAGYNADTFSLGSLSQWNVSKVTNMYSMFSGAYQNSNTSWDASMFNNWDMSSVEDVRNMFQNCSTLSGNLTLDISDTCLFGGIFTGTSTKTGALLLVTGQNDEIVANMVASRTAPTSSDTGVYMKMTERTLAVTPTSINVKWNEDFTVNWTVNNVDLIHNKDLAWESSNEAVIQLKQEEPSNDAQFYVLGPGTSTITYTITDADGTTYSKTCTITIGTTTTVTPVYLYQNGDECTELTGGWTGDGYGNSASEWHDGHNNGEHIVITGSELSFGKFGTTNTINLSGYTKLCCYVSSTSSSNCRFRTEDVYLVLEEGINIIDISNMSEESVYFTCTDGRTEISSVWME